MLYPLVISHGARPGRRWERSPWDPPSHPPGSRNHGESQVLTWFQMVSTIKYKGFLANVVRASIKSIQSDWSLTLEQHASGVRLPPKGEEGHGKAQAE